VDPQESGGSARLDPSQNTENITCILRNYMLLQEISENYGKFTTPLDSLLKKNSFVWSKIGKQAFFILKDAICTTLVLEVPSFTKTFFLECDASGRGLGVVLMEEGHPLSFMSKQLHDFNL
jgi:hypothetical protein